jgi:hypothetical protein
MPMWVWIAIGVGTLLVVAVVVGLVLAAILGAIGRKISELYDDETWATLPPTRSAQEPEEQERAEAETRDAHAATRRTNAH